MRKPILFFLQYRGASTSIELKNINSTKIYSWIHLTYDFNEIGCQVHVETSDARELTYHYVLANEIYQLTQVTISNIYDPLGRKICTTDRYGNSTIYEYDAFHRLEKVIHPEVLDEHSKIIRPSFSYTYDLFGNVLTAEDPKGSIIAMEISNFKELIEYV